MKDFFELLVKKFGLPEFLASYVMLVFYLMSGAYIAFKAIKAIGGKIKKRFIRRIVDQDLHPYFTHNEIYKYTKYYIPQYYQNITPSEGEELGKIYAAAARSKLMPEFIKKGLLTESPIKYFIILSDTGMGKTAFLINLYKQYKKKGLGLGSVKYDINLFPLGSKNALGNIKSIQNKKNTILLLDAFDEDIKAVVNYKSRMIEILDEVHDFRKVIFTCRTQFFPSKDEEPTDTTDITFGENIKHSIHKLYLSAFDDSDVLKYLFKKYELNIYRLYRAYNLVRKCPSLMFRPMLLTYIDDLIEGEISYEYSYQMYEVLINAWVYRESLKPAIARRHNGQYTYAEKLLKFSFELAVNLYEEREKRQGYLITIDDLKKLLSRKSIGADVLSLDDSTGRSLLNRNGTGQFKFAHKSILEFFLACEIFSSPQFLARFDFHGMDATQNFYFEMLANTIKHFEGTFYLKNDAKVKSLASVTPSQIKHLDKITITKANNLKAENFAGLTGLRSLIIANEVLLPLYIIYLYVDLVKLNDKQYPNTYNTRIETSMEPYGEIVRDVRQTLPNLNRDYIKILFENCEIEKNLRTKLYNFLDHGDSPQYSLSGLDLIRESITHSRSEKALIIEGYDNFKIIKKIKTFLPHLDMVF